MKALLSALFTMVIFLTVNAQPKIGTIAPDISLTNNNGQTIKLSSLRGKVVLVDFWASWCMPCRKSNHAILPVYNKYKNKGFEVYGISLDQDSVAWQKAVMADRINWLQFNETGGWETNTANAWKIEFLPTSFLLDKNGMIISIDPGTTELNKYLQQALK
ncbi:peroxiredoxin family protein [Flavihumibacter fluvii]|uniref:peroxiredoxin family protein n=1 Tax=Flavihumibacter fluvii TaxID=2838157 RepID=UPI001BDF1810|nr:TlpA family protein disulfide reductase [Flavihumibacter fluvii]ULQ53544.1 TlpA family protein disulfide reductase [Flavihumibacter fluvii]